MMRARYIWPFLFASLAFVFLASFSFSEDTSEQAPDQEIPELVKLELERKLLKFRRTVLARCRKEAIADAEIYVDSIVAAEFGDTLVFPTKPVRPHLPKKIILNDSTGISPILDN